MKLFNNKWFSIYIYLFILNIVVDSSTTTSVLELAFLDQGCVQATVVPPSGYIIPDRSRFELTVTFNSNITHFWVNSRDYLSLSDQELLLSLKEPYPIMYLYDKLTGIDYLPSIASSKGTSYQITLTFINLPISNNLLFIQDLGLIFTSYSIGPKSIISYSTNNMIPPQPTINTKSLNNCPNTIIDKSWNIDQPSNMNVYPGIDVKVKECTLSTVGVCSSDEKYYYEIVFPISLAQGDTVVPIPQFLHQAYRYEFFDTDITISSALDSKITIPLEFDRYYSVLSESVMLSKHMTPVNSILYSYGVFLSETQVNKILDDKRSGVYDTVYFTNASLVFNQQNQQIPITGTVDFNYLIKNHNDAYFVFVKNNVGHVYLSVVDRGISRYYLKYVDCPNQSKRNVYTVDAPSSTIHLFLGMGSYSSYRPSLPFITRQFDVSVSNTMVTFNVNDTGSSSVSIADKDSVSVVVEFNTQPSQYSNLVNNNKFLYGNNMGASIESSLVLPNSRFGESFNQIGVDIGNLLSQPNFCSMEFGTNVNNQIPQALSDSLYSLDKVLPNYGIVSGLNRIKFNQNSIQMKVKSDYASIKIQTAKLKLKEPLITPDDVSFTLVPGTLTSPCDGRVQVDVRNSGNTKGLVNFQLDCEQDVFIEMINYVLEIGPGDKGSFFTNVFISKFYKNPIQCRVSMWIIGLPLWSKSDNALEKNITFTPYQGCDIPDPCIGVVTEPLLLSSTPVLSTSPINEGNFLNSYTISSMVKNIGDSIGDVQVTLSCKNPNPTDHLRFTILKPAIEKRVMVNENIEFVHKVYIESSPLEHLHLSCNIDIHLYKPNVCWPLWEQQKDSHQINVPVPFDICVINTQEAYIQYSLFNYSHGYANPFFSFNSPPWVISLDQTSTISHHPLSIESNQANQAFIKSNQTAMNIIYQSSPSFQVYNGGNANAEFTITIDQCSSEIKLITPGTYITTIPTESSALFPFMFASYASNLDYYHVSCKLTIVITNQTCFNSIGKYHQQDIYIYPHYDPCAGNWLEPSLYTSTIDPPPSSQDEIISIQQNEWKPITKSTFYKDISFPVKNADLGTGMGLSDLSCSGMNTVITKVVEKSSCHLDPLSTCYHTFRIQSDASVSADNIEYLSCTLDVWLDRTDTCWSNVGKYQSKTFQIPKIVDPCLSFKEPFITSELIQLIPLNQWSMIDDPVTTMIDYWNTSTPRPVYYKTHKIIQIQNTGDSSATVNSIVSILYPTVELVPQESILQCTIQSYSYCHLKFTFLTRDIETNLLDLLLNISSIDLLVVDPMICWSGKDKHQQITIQTYLPGPPCPSNIPQPWLLYEQEYIGTNTSYYIDSDNPLNIIVGHWYDNKVNVSGKVINRGTGGAIIAFDIVCKSNIAVKTSDNLSITLIESDKYGYFNVELTLDPEKLSLSSSPIIPCVVSAIVNKQYCWSSFGKSISQKFPILPPTLVINDNSKNNTRDILLGILIPLSILFILSLLYLCLGKHFSLISFIKDLIIDKFKDKNNNSNNNNDNGNNSDTSNIDDNNGDTNNGDGNNGDNNDNNGDDNDNNGDKGDGNHDGNNDNNNSDDNDNNGDNNDNNGDDNDNNSDNSDNNCDNNDNNDNNGNKGDGSNGETNTDVIEGNNNGDGGNGGDSNTDGNDGDNNNNNNNNNDNNSDSRLILCLDPRYGQIYV